MPTPSRVSCTSPVMVMEFSDIVLASRVPELSCLSPPPRLVAPLICNTEYRDQAEMTQRKAILTGVDNGRYKKFPAVGYIAVQVRCKGQHDYEPSPYLLHVPLCA